MQWSIAAAERMRQLHDDVRAVIGECMEAVSAELTFFTLPNCFELFGFDLLLDERVASVAAGSQCRARLPAGAT